MHSKLKTKSALVHKSLQLQREASRLEDELGDKQSFMRLYFSSNAQLAATFAQLVHVPTTFLPDSVSNAAPGTCALVRVPDWKSAVTSRSHWHRLATGINLTNNPSGAASVSCDLNYQYFAHSSLSTIVLTARSVYGTFYNVSANAKIDLGVCFLKLGSAGKTGHVSVLNGRSGSVEVQVDPTQFEHNGAPRSTVHAPLCTPPYFFLLP